jgi:hypothetical protein
MTIFVPGVLYGSFPFVRAFSFRVDDGHHHDHHHGEHQFRREGETSGPMPNGPMPNLPNPPTSTVIPTQTRGRDVQQGERAFEGEPAERGREAAFQREPRALQSVLQLHHLRPFEVANGQNDNNDNNNNDNIQRSCLQRFWQRFCANKTCPNYISIPSFCAACAVGVLAFTNNNILQVTTANLETANANWAVAHAKSETANANLEIANAFVVQSRAAWDVCTDQLQAVWDEQRCQFF